MIITGNIQIPENKADIIVRSVLIKMGYSKELELKRYILDDNKIIYVVYNPIMYHGKKTKIMRLLSCREYMEYLISSFQEKDNVVDSIYPKINNNNNNNITYYLTSRPNYNRTKRKVR